jgi:hypothetical protein
MFHVQLRQFPHNHSQFNLTAGELRTLAETWVRGQWLMFGERRWSPHQATLTVIEGPRAALEQLSMGRGWRHVERHGEDVTRRVLDAAAATVAQAATAPSGASAAPVNASGHGQPGRGLNPTAEELQALLGEAPRAEALLVAWRRIAARSKGRSPSECLSLAEEELDSSHRGGS